MFDQATMEMLLEGVLDTLYMTLISTLFSYVFGMVMGTVLVICRPGGICPRPVVYGVLDVVVNLTRSFPFLILMIAVIPFTRFVVGTTIGNNATVVPLVIAAAPFVARLVESSLLEVDAGVIEAAQSMGASTMQIITKVLLPESTPSLLNGSAIAATTILGYSAMSGAVGGGGLGKLAIMYGYNRYQTDIMFATVILLIIIVQIFQSVGNWATKKVTGVYPTNTPYFCHNPNQRSDPVRFYIRAYSYAPWLFFWKNRSLRSGTYGNRLEKGERYRAKP